MPVFQKKKNESMVHNTRMTSRRNKDKQGLTVPRNIKENKAKSVSRKQRSSFTDGKNG